MGIPNPDKEKETNARDVRPPANTVTYANTAALSNMARPSTRATPKPVSPPEPVTPEPQEESQTPQSVAKVIQDLGRQRVIPDPALEDAIMECRFNMIVSTDDNDRLEAVANEFNRAWGLRANLGVGKSSVLRAAITMIHLAMPQITQRLPDYAEEHHHDIRQRHSTRDQKGLRHLDEHVSRVLQQGVKSGATLPPVKAMKSKS